MESYIGQSVNRLDAKDKVAGRAEYGADITFPGMIYGKTLRSPHPHAILKKIDFSKAKKLKGVLTVLTANDVPGLNRHGEFIPDQPVLVQVGDKVRMIGDPVALVAADTEEVAEKALDLIEVDYEPLGVVGDIESALEPDSIRVHDECEGNVCGFPWYFERGDVEKAFAEADVIVEEVFNTPRQEHAYLEPESGVANINSRGEIEIYAAMQNPSYFQFSISKILGCSAHKIHIISPLIGGSFGGKCDISLHAHLALLSLKLNRPVKMVWSRKESFLASPKRHPTRIHHKMSATKDGRITGLKVDFIMDGGAYASHSPVVLIAMGGSFPGPYDIPNIKIAGKALYTNNPISGAMRGYGLPQAVTATECQIDALCRKLKIDPFEFRIINALVAGKSKPLPYLIEPIPFISLDSTVTLPQTLMKAKEIAGSLKKPSAEYKRTGRAICCSMPLFDVSAMPVFGMMGTNVSVEILPDGSAMVRSSAVEFGQGVTTVLGQIAAEEFGISLDKVNVVLGDTRTTPKSGATIASRTTYCCGNALMQAAQKIKAILLQEASDLLEAPADILFMKNNRVYVKESPPKGISMTELSERCYNKGINLKSESWFTTNHAGFGHTFMSKIADVEVDIETGKVEVLKLITVHDIGKAINPQLVEGQLTGGKMQGLGYVLMEDMITKKGGILTPSLIEYLIPTVEDLPEELHNILVEEPYPTGPYGAKGVGEFGLDTVAPVILNAVYDAIGIRFTKFPLTPQRVWEEIQKKQKDSNGEGIDGSM